MEIEQGIDKNQNGYDVITEACRIQFEVDKNRSFILGQKNIANVIRNNTKNTNRIKGLKLPGQELEAARVDLSFTVGVGLLKCEGEEAVRCQ